MNYRKEAETKKEAAAKRELEAKKEAEEMKEAEAKKENEARKMRASRRMEEEMARQREEEEMARHREEEELARQREEESLRQQSAATKKGPKKILGKEEALRQELEMDRLEQEEAMARNKPKQKSRPTSREGRLSGAGAAQGGDEMFGDEQQQQQQQDLFAAISDTSLKSGKKKQRKKVRPEQEYEDSDEDDIPQKKPLYKSRTTSRDRLGNVAQEESSNFKTAKSRTASRERPRDEESIAMTSTSGPQSRTASRDGKMSQQEMEVDSSTRLQVKSRPQSGDGKKSRQEAMEVDIPSSPPLSRSQQSRDGRKSQQQEQYMSSEYEEAYTEPARPTAKKGNRSRTSSKDGQKIEAVPEMHEVPEAGRPTSRKAQLSRTSSQEKPQRQMTSRQQSADQGQSGSRPPSRTGSRFSDVMSDQFEPELTWDDDEDMEEESLPSLAPMPRLSRTDSAEKREYGPDEPGAKIKSLPRPGSRSLAQEDEALRIMSEQEAYDKERARSQSKGKKSRTVSREKLKQDSFESQQPSTDSYFEMDSSEPEPIRTLKSRTQSREGTRQQQIDEIRPGAKSRTKSRERPRDFTQELYPEEKVEFEEEQLRAVPRGAKSRTHSDERHPSSIGQRGGSFGESDRRSGAKSRSMERPGSGGLREQPPMWPEEEDSELHQHRTRSRTNSSSADRRKLVGGGRDELLAEDPGFDPGYDTLPTGPSPGGYRNYRDEMELDTRQYVPAYEGAAMDSSDTFNPDRYEDDDDEPPPAEPIYGIPRPRSREAAIGRYPEEQQPQFSVAQDTFEHVPMDQTGAFDSDYRYDEEHYASEMDHEIDDKDSSRISKKVSFAESDQIKKLKPEPDVKTIKGTKLFTFAPSSTHEQPKEEMFDSGIPKPIAVSESITQSEADISESHYSTAPSTSPKAFLKAMATGLKGNQQQKEERGGSVLDNILRRGRSSSAQGSRSSSRQSSLDREARRAGGSSRSDYSTGSQEFEVKKFFLYCI